MLVVSMNSKRQRRPNVRFGEIGDISASFACRFSQKTEENLGPKSWNCEEGQAFDEKEFVPFTSDACSNYSSDCIKDISDQVTPATSKEACEHDVYGLTYDTWQQANFHACQEEDFYDGGNNSFPKSDGVWNELRGGDSEVNSVKRWLEKLGFGKYAAVFEMHEVDEEVLPLLALEDLKEMGVFAVGTRRKLYNAIQQLRGGYSSAELIE
ncbi:Sterile alpha motif domain-containing protein [Quillaja saponaria]|uniref:Sterile alpha motif domain-containing protein n=1 Tax=Quillaja saponaria TaxID=32244 RepID=A0AAD7QCB1_QUISA|nr:Sterile alpha motif domain-containing protein [Quillaja saponaria]